MKPGGWAVLGVKDFTKSFTKQVKSSLTDPNDLSVFSVIYAGMADKNTIENLPS